MLRTALTGILLLWSGKIVTDLTALLDEYGFSESRELVAQKRAGERVVLDVPLRGNGEGGWNAPSPAR